MPARILGQDFFQMPRIGLKRADEAQILWRRSLSVGRINATVIDRRYSITEKIFELSRRAHLRQPVLSALLGRFNRDLLPFGLFLRRAFKIDMHNGAIGKDGRNLGRADLDRFLHDHVHVLPFWNGLAERDAAPQRRRFRFVRFSQANLVFGSPRRVRPVADEIDNLCRDLAPAAVEDNEFVAALQSQDIARVMRLRVREDERIRIPIFRRNIETVHDPEL